MAFYRLRNVNLFASGEYRGKPWPPAVILTIAKNAALLGPKGKNLLVPPAAPGHEDDADWQRFVGDVDAPGPRERTDEPAAGWVDPSTVRAVPDTKNPGEMLLTGDVVNVPQQMADAIRSGLYSFGSSEIYSDFTDDFGTTYGQALRKFSYLGGEVPQVKRLGRLPAPEPMSAPIAFAERRHVRIREERRSPSLVLAFAERTAPMPTDRFHQTELGKVRRFAATLPSAHRRGYIETFAECARRSAAKGQRFTAAEFGTPGAAPPAASPSTGAAPDRQALIASIKAAMPGLSQATLDALTPEQLADLAQNLPAGGTGGGVAMAEGDGAAMSREEMIAELVAGGYDATELEGASDDELRAALEEMKAEDADTEADASVAAFAERLPARARDGFVDTYSRCRAKWGARKTADELLGRR